MTRKASKRVKTRRDKPSRKRGNGDLKIRRTGRIICAVCCLWQLCIGIAHADRELSICYDFGCRNEAVVTLNNAQWESVEALFDAANAQEERDQIKAALGYMEYLAGEQTPISRDLAMNLPLSDTAKQGGLFPGQLDCIDESINASRFLALFHQAGLLRFHRVLDRAYRRSFLTQHWAAQVEEVETGVRYVFDTWFEPNGRPPIMVSATRWNDLSL